MSRFILSAVFSFLMLNAFSQYEWSSNCKNAYENIISLKFDEGREWLKKEKLENPENLIPAYLQNYIDFLTLYIGENEDDYNRLEPNKGKRLRLLKDSDRDSPYYNYCLANIYLQWAFVRVKFGEHFNAFFEIRKAYRLLEINREKYPDFLPDNIGMGLLHALVGSIPDQYNWVVDLLGFSGSVNEGMRELDIVVKAAIHDSNYAYLLPESLFFLSFIEVNLSKEKENTIELVEIFNQLPGENPLVVFAKSSLLMKNGFNDKAINVLKTGIKENTGYRFDFLKYLLGLAKLSRLDDDASGYLLDYLIYFEGRNYLASACQKLAWYYLIKGDSANYKNYINKSLLYKDGVIEADHQAHFEAKKNRYQNVHLLRARLLFDGGYYNEALEYIIQPNVQDGLRDNPDQVEYYYRLGRIYHELDEFEKALKNYATAIDRGSGFDEYYAGNAALLSGRIYERRKDFESAKKSYKKCLGLNFKEYEKSIKGKAKAGLNRIAE